jgi:hypothetical protein
MEPGKEEIKRRKSCRKEKENRKVGRRGKENLEGNLPSSRLAEGHH